MRIQKLFIYTVLTLITCFGHVKTLQAQSGDQILDGIGETGLIARYVFDGDAKDWSRNNLHAKISGDKAEFIDDDQFGKVLSLPAAGKAYVTVPKDALTGVESLSITGWVFLDSEQPGQRFFDFGKNNNAHFFVAPTGTKVEEGCQAQISTDRSKGYKTVSNAIKAHQWNQLTVVIDVSAESMSTYVNGKQVGETKNVELDLEKVFDKGSGGQNLFYIGR